MSRAEDISGRIFERLTVIKRVENNKRGNTMWLCKCSCDGNEKTYLGNSLRSGNTKSCGCIHKEITSENMKQIVQKYRRKYNTYDLSGDYGIGVTGKDEEFYFDLEDYDKIKGYYWVTDKEGYLMASSNNTYIKQSRLIMSPNDNEIVDHIFHNVYDNRKVYLRIATHSQNGMNQIMHTNNTSGVKGVSWHIGINKWVAAITVDYKQMYLGQFDSFEDAVKIRKDAEVKYFGEYQYIEV